VEATLDAEGAIIWQDEVGEDGDILPPVVPRDSTLTREEVRQVRSAYAPPGTSTILTPCEAWLSSFLADGPQTAKDAEAAAKVASFSHRTVARAKVAIGACTRKVGGGSGSYWVWELPGAEVSEEDPVADSSDGDGEPTSAIA